MARCLITGALASIFSLSVSPVIAEETTGPRTWSGRMQAHASESLADTSGLSVAAIPLNGPGIEQFVNADTPMNPGSIMKVLTTYAALEILGPTHHWDTRFYTDGQLSGSTLDGNLYVRFGGDPKLTIERLWSVMRELRGMGVSTITGDLVLDGEYFRLPEGLPLFDDNGDNPHAPFLVEPSAWLTNLNLLHFEVRADERGTQAWSTPALANVVIDNRVVATDGANCPARRDFNWEPAFSDDGRITVQVTGELARGCRTSTYLSLMSHQQYSAALIRSLWDEMGGTLAGSDRFEPTPDDARLMMVTTSPDLVSMVRDINKWSSNVMARQLLLTIGAENRLPEEEDDRVAGIRVIYEWLESKGINTAGMVIDNGAGLSRYERITARQTAKVLQSAWNSRFSADLLSSLPLIAMDGTMARRLRNTALEGEGRIKTGYLQDVRSIAGFSRDKTETSWAVVGMVNHTPAWNGQALLDRVLYSLYYNPPVGTALSRGPTGSSAVQ
ncbi:D-alanyl-D-alanine carboxypeptidase/D-alanyl-D-alanine-endopeptidase [Marinobacter sp.]|uniref:D-alanyl-D-alanine carboxypeptidase/D-alanyl-D-alanine endopeptidase n=1 Tax=Marinobacter sp. TaxID=50741 RepID=UPI00385071C1